MNGLFKSNIGKTMSNGIVIFYIYYNTNQIRKSTENLILSKNLKQGYFFERGVKCRNITQNRSGKTVGYICPKCKYKFDAPIEAVLEFEQEDEWNGLPISTPPYTICAKCKFDKCVPIDYVSKRGFHHIYKDN